MDPKKITTTLSRPPYSLAESHNLMVLRDIIFGVICLPSKFAMYRIVFLLRHCRYAPCILQVNYFDSNRNETVQSLFVAKSRTVLLGECVLEAVESEVCLKTLLGQGLDFRRLELELGHSQVVPQSAFLGGGGDGNDSLVDGPAQGHGFLADAVLGGQRLQEIIDGTGSGSSVDGGQRTESLNGDAVLLRPGQEVLALEVGVEFDLVNHGLQGSRRPDGLEVLRHEVGHTNGLGLARLLDLLHLGPSSLELGSVTGMIEWVVHGVLGLALGKPGRVNQIQIDVVGLELLQGLGDRTLDVVNVGDDLGGDE